MLGSQRIEQRGRHAEANQGELVLESLMFVSGIRREWRRRRLEAGKQATDARVAVFDGRDRRGDGVVLRGKKTRGVLVVHAGHVKARKDETLGFIET